MTSIDILHRRILVFELWTCRHIAPKRIVEILEKRDIRGATIKTVRRDISTLKEWLPEIVKLKENSSQVTAELLGKHQVTQQRLLNLAETADNSNAQVGALRASVDAINAEVDLRLKTGQISAVPQRFEVSSDVSEDELSRVIPVIVNMVMGEQVRATKQGMAEEDTKEPLDPSHPNP